MSIIVFNPQNRDTAHDLDTVIAKYPNLDLVISLGGDGTILGAFNAFPQLPILPIKSSNLCSRCFPITDLSAIIEQITKGLLTPTPHNCIQATFNNTTITALNEINVHSQNPQSAIRYSYSYHHFKSTEIIADGIVFSTPFGSTGYYRSITNTTFEQGIGIGINNPTVHQYHQVVLDNTEITLMITRGPALLLADNQKDQIILDQGNQITINTSPIKAKIFSAI